MRDIFRYTFSDDHKSEDDKTKKWRTKILVPVDAKRREACKKIGKNKTICLGAHSGREEAVLAAKRWIDEYYKSWPAWPTVLGSRRKTECTRIFKAEQDSRAAGGGGVEKEQGWEGGTCWCAPDEGADADEGAEAQGPGACWWLL